MIKLLIKKYVVLFGKIYPDISVWFILFLSAPPNKTTFICASIYNKIILRKINL